MRELSIADSFSGFEMFKKMTPIASALEGLFSTKLSLNGDLDDISVTASGGHAFDGGMDYNLNMNIPAKYLGDSTGGLLASLSAQEKATMILPLPVNLGGTLSDPKIGLDMKSAVTGLTQQIVASQKEKAKQKVTSEVTKQLNKKISGATKDVIGGLLGNKKNTDTTTSKSTKQPKKTDDAIKEKAGKLIEGLLKRK